MSVQEAVRCGPHDEPVPQAGQADNPCLACGACCAAYRVAFYWAEIESRGLPAALTQRLDPWRACMVGTQARQPRCVALQGTVGKAVTCSVHPMRPSPCRDVNPGTDQCRRARAAHGLPALTG